MSSKNEDVYALPIIAAVIAAVLMFLFAVLAFLAFASTFVALLAWDEPMKLGAKTITPKDAHEFVGRGIMGAFLLPVFCAFFGLLVDYPIVDEFWPYLLIGGYTLGSLGVALIEAAEEQRLKREAILLRPIQPPSPPLTFLPPQSIPKPPPQPFQFASWNDEEKLK